MNIGFQGIDIRQTNGGNLLFRTFLQDSNGNIVPSGTATLQLYEFQSDATLKTYDFNNSAFTTGILTTPTTSLIPRKAAGTTVDTGLYTTSISTSGFTLQGIYIAHTYSSNAFPTDQMREFQFGSAQGDIIIPANGRTPIQSNIISASGLDKFPFFMTLTDHITPASGKTITSVRSIDGSPFSLCSNSAVENSSGWYYINLSSTDVAGKTVALDFIAPGCDTRHIEIVTQP